MIHHAFDASSTSVGVTRAIPMTPHPFGQKRRSASLVTFYFKGGKRMFDLALCLTMLPVVIPLVALLALLIAATGSMPFYTQHRIGQNGRIFKMWKLRSMVHNSDSILAQHLATDPIAKREWQFTQKLRHDPRITIFGAFLRRSSLDELPQVWNVIKGEMSLVGPRPMMISQEPLYLGSDYYDLRPGISGNWQVSARNESSFADRALFDSEYLATVSFIADLRILGKTVGVVLRATGH